MDDRSIVALYLRRDETAIRQTAEKYGSRLRALAKRSLLRLPRPDHPAHFPELLP